MTYFTLFIIGACLGSFANVCIYRWLNEQTLEGRSKCPTCNTTIKWYDLIPILSFFLLKGKCRYCKASIDLQYPFIEFISGFLLIFTSYTFGFSLESIIVYLFLYLFLIAMVCDIKETIVPNEIIVLGLFLMLFALLTGFIPLINSLIGFFTVFAVLYAFISIFGEDTIGGGDIKLLMVLGGIFGIELAFYTFIYACYIQSITFLYFLFEKDRTKRAICLVPALFFGFLVAYLLK